MKQDALKNELKFIVTTRGELSEIIDDVVEKRLSVFLNQQPSTVTPTKQGNYTSKELQELFNLKSPVSVWQWEKKGILHPVIIQRKKFYLREDIEKLIKQKTLNKRA